MTGASRGIGRAVAVTLGYVKELQRFPVSKLVNRVENNSKECMEPVKKNGD